MFFKTLLHILRNLKRLGLYAFYIFMYITFVLWVGIFELFFMRYFNNKTSLLKKIISKLQIWNDIIFNNKFFSIQNKSNFPFV